MFFGPAQDDRAVGMLPRRKPLLAILIFHRIPFLQAVIPSRYSTITFQPYCSGRFFTQIVLIQVILNMGKRPHVRPEAGERESRHVQLLPYSQPYLFFHILQS
jgi:hypothetical protein